MSEQTFPALRELQARPQWVCWRKEQRRGKGTKVPYNPRTGERARPNDSTTWTSYAEALATWQKHPRRYDGIGYMFHRDLTGVDIDHCIDEQGQIEPWAWAIVKRLASYAEYSPSRTGLHILVRGAVPKGIHRSLSKSLPHLQPLHPDAAIEVYCEGRYFTITANHVEGTPTTIEANQGALDTLYAEITALESLGTPAGTLSPQTISLDDEQLLQKATQASNGSKFRALFYQGSAGYPSASEADMALCLMLAFWTGRDPERMDRLFRKSALYREKWDTGRSQSTYGQDTIHKAAALCRAIYDPLGSRKQLERDIEQVLVQVEGQQSRLSANKNRKLSPLIPKEVPISKVFAYLDENEYGDARFFAEVFADQVCYDHTDKEWYLWDGHHWKRDATSKVRQLVAGVLGTLYLKAAAELNTEQAELDLKIETAKRQGEDSEQIATLISRSKALTGQIAALRSRANALRTLKRMNSVLTIVQSEMGITAEEWDSNPWLLAVPNGVLDLHTGTCRDGEPGDYIRTVCPTEWTGLQTPCPRFEQFLQELFEDKPDRETLIAFLHRLLGYSITGLTMHHLFPIFYGEEGRNGKDTLLDTLKGVLGALVGAVSNDVFIAQDKLRAGGAATPHLCDLQGKRLVWGSETKEGDRLNIAQIKHLTGGGDISARQLHGHQYTFPPTHKLLLMTNYKPHADARDKAFWARACLIEFGIRFVDQPHAPNERQADLTLKETLKQERSGILAWLVRGCLAWQEQGLNVPASVLMATDKYREDEDKLVLFVQECCLVAPDVIVGGGALFKAYREWHEGSQFGGRGMNSKLFGEEMKKRFTWKISNGRVTYQGIGLLPHDDDPPTLFSEGHEGARFSTTDKEPPSEANSQETEEVTSRGSRGQFHVFTKNQEKVPPIEEKHGKSLYSLTDPPSVTINKPPSEAIADSGEQEPMTLTDPHLPDEPHPCTTRYEKRSKGAHQAIATRLSAGCYWCEKCEPQCAWMEYGETKNYPKVDVSAHHFQVKQGRESWLTFAQEAGYRFVQYALEAAQRPESFEL